MGVIWFILWVVLCHDEPPMHPCIRKSELDYLTENVEPAHTVKLPPWKGMFTNVPFWALVMVQWGHSWGLFSPMTDLPKFMKDVLDYNVSRSGYMSASPWLLMWALSLIFGWISDYLIAKGKFSYTVARKVFSSIAQIGPAVFIAAASMPGIRNWPGGPNISCGFIVIGFGLMGAFLPGFRVNALDISPKYAGTVTGITNGLGALAGVFASLIAGLLTKGLTDKKDLEWAWFYNFSIGSLWLISTDIIFVIWGTADIQPFNDM
ncbi:putative inorganic phosphate cotransporter [Ctenocephalides felis]|uniref:putative inorganic phosphate cotransporter n=1 Tax=Ctenocephalides felis TaxID=7515 RepID=UPI000E6E19C7|nr:putative inorganic phosphate cotransporter [Ctenocephalides felis]